MTIDDKIEKTLDNLWHESEVNVMEEAFFAAVAAIPKVGGSINSLLTGRAKRRVVERAIEVFNAIKERLEQVDENKIDREFFESEEFQTLFALVLAELQSTHDKAKLQMLAAALANGGITDFSSETRKELFVRILRDLSPNHIRVLRGLLPESQLKRDAGPTFWPTSVNPDGEDLAVLQNLAANGLVDEFLQYTRNVSLNPRFGTQWTETEIGKTLKKYLEEAPSRSFRISRFGMDFLEYVGQRGKTSTEASE